MIDKGSEAVVRVVEEEKLLVLWALDRERSNEFIKSLHHFGLEDWG